MKIDRVVFCLNSNPLYRNFWNVFSRVWKDKFDITPTLLFSGSEEELRAQELSEQYGEIIRLNPVPEVVVDPTLDWSITWALFWGPTLFPEDVCLTSGIDQLPLSDMFMKLIKDIPEDDYVVGFSDAYTGCSHFPSSHHVAKGKNYKKIYDIDSSWENEVKKVFKSAKTRHTNLPSNLWGLDELYSSEVLRSHPEFPEKVHLIKEFHTSWNPRRLCRSRLWGWDKAALKNGEYSELHAPRPYNNGNNKKFIDSIVTELLEE